MWDIVNLRLLLVFYQAMIFTTADERLMRIEINGGDDLVELNFSNMGLKSVDQQALLNVTHLKMFNLSRNFLEDLPKSVFKNLTSLEYLDLANNRLTSGNFYDGLSSLQVLDISNNSIESFGPGHFFGLSNSISIITEGLRLSTISPAMFKKAPRHDHASQGKYTTISNEYSILDWKRVVNSSQRDSGIAINVCLQSDRLNLVQMLLENEFSPTEGCIKAYVIHGILNLDELNITTFARGWFRMENDNVSGLYLQYNRIERIEKKVLNHLPRGINKVSLRGNEIKSLKAGIMKNVNPMDVLDLRENLIDDIEYKALEKLNLTNKLYLDNNQLMNTDFMDSLPFGIEFVSLAYNKITQISVGNFENFTQFHYLNLSHNEIWELVPNSPSNFSSLLTLDLSYNLVSVINPRYFKQMENIQSLYMANNRLKEFHSLSFEYILELGSLSLASNGITEIEKGAAKYLNHLTSLDLSDNPIKVLSDGALFGLQKTNITEIKVANVPVEFISGGVFDEFHDF